MKIPAGSPLFALLAQPTILMADLFTFLLPNAAQDRFTSLDIPVTWGGQIFKANSLRIEGLKYKVAVGLEVDEQEVKISALPTDTLAGALFLPAVAAGLLDGATLVRERAFWAPTTGIPAVDFQAAPVGVVTLFTGRISEITRIGRTHAEMKIKSPLALLDIDLPRNPYQPGCLWELYSAGCTVSAAAYTTTFTASASSNKLSIYPNGGIASPIGADGLPFYAQGRLFFLNGPNANIVVTIAANDGTSFALQRPLASPPNAGDSFQARAGCSKTSATCDLKFNNADNFRGFPRIPPMVMSI